MLRPTVVLLLSVNVLLGSSSALAAGSDDPPPRVRVRVAGGVRLLVDPSAVATTLGASGYATVRRHLAVGGFLETSLGARSLGEYCEYDAPGCHPRLYRFGGSVRVDAMPTSWFDPWLGANLGVALFTGEQLVSHRSSESHTAVSSFPILEAMAGIDLRIGQAAFGPWASIGAGPSFSCGVNVGADF